MGTGMDMGMGKTCDVQCVLPHALRLADGADGHHIDRHRLAGGDHARGLLRVLEPQIEGPCVAGARRYDPDGHSVVRLALTAR